MTLYSKNGSIPYPTKDESDGWIEVEDAPTPGDGEEVVWWYPPGWVVRPVKPKKEGSEYVWHQSTQSWFEFSVESVAVEVAVEVVVDPASLEVGSSSLQTSGIAATGDEIVAGAT